MISLLSLHYPTLYFVFVQNTTVPPKRKSVLSKTKMKPVNIPPEIIIKLNLRPSLPPLGSSTQSLSAQTNQSRRQPEIETCIDLDQMKKMLVQHSAELCQQLKNNIK